MIILAFLVILLLMGAARGGQLVGREDWLFIGYSNTFFGSSLAHGFVNQITKQVVSVVAHNAALPYSNTKAIFDFLQHEDFINKPVQRAFYIIEAEAILSNYSNQQDTTFLTNPVEYPNSILSEIESILAYLSTRGVDVTMCVLLTAGERSTENQLELHYEEWKPLLKQASIDYKVSFLDLTMAFDKYNELVNIDDVDHSTLTHDGYILNDQGHTVVAHELLSSIGIGSMQQAVDKNKWSILKRKTTVEEIEKLRIKYENKVL